MAWAVATRCAKGKWWLGIRKAYSYKLPLKSPRTEGGKAGGRKKKERAAEYSPLVPIALLLVGG
jgi:hypothetical protein